MMQVLRGFRNHTKALHITCLLIALFLAGVAFGPAVKGPFFFDDEHFILRNTSIQSLANIPEIYRTTVTQSAHIVGNFYRPNQQLLYALMYQAFGTTTAVPYHLASILIHLANVVLLVRWLSLLGLAPGAAWLAGLFFLVHPVQTEAVAYISGLADPMALFFILSGLLAFTKGMQESSTKAHDPRLSLVMILPALFFVMAMTSKENGVVFLPCIILTGVYLSIVQGRPLPRRILVAFLLCALMTAGYLGLKFTVLNFTKSIGLTDDVNAYTTDLTLRLTTFLHVLWDYAGLIVAPTDLYYEKPYIAYPGFGHERAWFGMASLAGSVWIVLRATRWPRLALGVGLFWAGLLPYMGIIPVNAMFLEHWLYVPMIGLSLVLATGATALWRLASPSRLRLAFAGGLVLLMGTAMTLRTRARAGEWADPERFYLNEIAHGSIAARTYNNLGLYYSEHAEADKAARYWQLATESAQSRPYPQPYHNLARYYLERQNLTAGLENLHRALQADPTFAYSLALLLDVYAAQGDQAKAHTVRTALERTIHGERYDFGELERQIFRDTMSAR